MINKSKRPPGCVFSSRSWEEGLQGREMLSTGEHEFREGFQGFCGLVAASCPWGALGWLSTQAWVWGLRLGTDFFHGNS